MKELNNYIIEKLRIGKSTKVLNKNVGEELFELLTKDIKSRDNPYLKYIVSIVNNKESLSIEILISSNTDKDTKNLIYNYYREYQKECKELKDCDIYLNNDTNMIDIDYSKLV